MNAFTFRNLVLLVLLSPVFNCFSQTDTIETQEKEPDFVNDIFHGKNFHVLCCWEGIGPN